MITPERLHVFANVSYHRDRMDEVHGDKTLPQLDSNHQLVILMEEVGEMARALIENDPAQYKLEAYDVAQVIVAILEGLV